MTTVHAWFSAATALTRGSEIYRKPSGATVHVTRVNAELEDKGRHPHDERYVGQVMRAEDGGCVRGNHRVAGITR